MFQQIKRAGVSKQSDAWKVVKQGKDIHAYVLFFKKCAQVLSLLLVKVNR